MNIGFIAGIATISIHGAAIDPITQCQLPLPVGLSPKVCRVGFRCMVLNTKEDYRDAVKTGEYRLKGANKYQGRFSKRRYPTNMKGVGWKVNGVTWSMFIVIPIIMSFLIMLGTSIAPLDTFAPVDTRMVFAFLLGAILSMIQAGALMNVSGIHPEMRKYDCFGRDATVADSLMRNGSALGLVFLSNACAIMSLRAAHIEFRIPSFYSAVVCHPFSACVKLVSAFALDYIIISFADLALYQSFYPDKRLLVRVCLKLFSRFLLCGFLPPGISMVVLFVTYKRREFISFYCWADTTRGCTLSQTFNYPILAISDIYVLPCCFAEYSRDRRFLSLMGFASSFAVLFGRFGIGRLSGAMEPSEICPEIAALLLFAYLCTLYGRKGRVLPPELQKVKYVKLGYLRRMKYDGAKIKRCQEMPAEAFGNVTKASQLIIISHRWLDRYACDVATPEYPNGLRLTTMVEKLEKHFPVTWSSLWASDSTIFGAAHAFSESILLGDSDVLLFFDFIGLPQIGLNADGSTIERTSEEQHIFQEALPAMGGLYAMYDVMVCPEVPEGYPDYYSSGWCFCELQSALLFEKLNEFSSNFIQDAGEHFSHSLCDDTYDDSLAKHFLSDFEEKLKTKVFFFEKDRDTVRTILKRKITGRMLIDAVHAQRLDAVEQLLLQMKDEGILAAINTPIDDNTLDSLLHVAVRLPSKEIVNLLLEHGANEDARNLVGDTPYKLFMIPRFWRASA